MSDDCTRSDVVSCNRSDGIFVDAHQQRVLTCNPHVESVIDDQPSLQLFIGLGVKKLPELRKSLHHVFSSRQLDLTDAEVAIA